MTSIDDPLGVRSDFRAATNCVYFDTPSVGPLPNVVEQAGIDFLRAQADRPFELPEYMRKANQVREKFARMVGASVHETGFLFATGEAENLITAALDLQPGDNIVIDDLHYVTGFVLYRSLEKTKGIELRVVPSVGGRAGLREFEPFVDARTRLVAVAWVSNRNGYRHSLKELVDLAHAHGALFYADAVQALGMFPVDLHAEGVDFISSGVYKWLFSGFGIAPFYIREDQLDRIRPDRLGSFSVAEEGPGHSFRLHDGARGFEYATLAFGPLYQLDAALDYLQQVGLDRIETHTVGLARTLRSELAERGFELLTPENNGSSVVAFVHGKDPAAARDIFKRRDVAVAFRANGTQIRAGVALFNNQADVEQLLDAADELRASG